MRRFCNAIAVPLFSARAEYEILDTGRLEADQVFLHVKQQRDIKTDQISICKLLGITYESADSSVTHKTIDSPQLPENATFINDEGRKYWL